MPVVLAHVAGALAPVQLVVPGLLSVAYAHRAVTLRRQGRPLSGARQACFYGALILIVVTLISPLGHVSDELFSMHMLEHLLIADLGALLLVLGLSGPLLAPILRIRAIDRLRVLAHPAVALPLWALDLLVWHLPVLYQAALHHPALHALEHAMFIAAGVNMWMPLFGPLPMPAWFGNAWRLAYVIAVRLLGALLANVFLWSGTVFYPAYRGGEGYWGLDPISDQVAAGAIVMVEGSILTLVLFAWLFLRTADQGEQRQALLDYAGDHGLELSPERATRAVAAGRGGQLRDRLEARGAEAAPAPEEAPAPGRTGQAASPGPPA
ncbi:MAG: putative rane protein [Solirubrobacteraceae bacterium]|jgi:cytochrome c oxidase assembly factor CtaG|nr:putative rane protein [Solirubrobacteraceae bacterium]